MRNVLRTSAENLCIQFSVNSNYTLLDKLPSDLWRMLNTKKRSELDSTIISSLM
jgi:hypothetical protein